MSELADELDLGSSAARRAGSSPAFPIAPDVKLPKVWFVVIILADFQGD